MLRHFPTSQFWFEKHAFALTKTILLTLIEFVFFYISFVLIALASARQLHITSTTYSIQLSIHIQTMVLRGLTTSSSSMGVRQQKPNRFTRVFQDMKSSCPSQITSYAQCVLKEETSGGALKGACEEEFGHVKECFRQVRLQKAML